LIYFSNNFLDAFSNRTTTIKMSALHNALSQMLELAQEKCDEGTYLELANLTKKIHEEHKRKGLYRVKYLRPLEQREENSISIFWNTKTEILELSDQQAEGIKKYHTIGSAFVNTNNVIMRNYKAQPTKEEYDENDCIYNDVIDTDKEALDMYMVDFPVVSIEPY
jgi:hypothetical protein